MPPKNKTIRQFISYALIGILTNFLGYVLYLLLTYFLAEPKLIMTVLYVTGALIGFFANRRFTFRHDDKIGKSVIRYLIAQLLGYFLNLTLLVVFVDWLDYKHQIVQAFAIIVVAIVLFLLSRFFVFASHLSNNGALRP